MKKLLFIIVVSCTSVYFFSHCSNEHKNDIDATLAEVEKFHQETGRADAAWLLRHDLSDHEYVMAQLMERRKDQLNYSLLQDGMKVCRNAYVFGRAHEDPRFVRAAVEFADALLRKHATPSGGFIEYSRNTWLTPSDMWKTIPWGTAFCGNQVFDAWILLKDEFSPEQRKFWKHSLENTAMWIYKNPVMGGYVFNNTIDLCWLLWRIGMEFDHPEWCQWALETAEQLILRDVDDEGWIKGELGGVSGYYQLIGANFLAKFAWESKSPKLEETVHHIFKNSVLPYATSTLDWPANFGTRVSGLRKIPGAFVLIAAALGDPVATYFVQKFGKPDWSDNMEIWKTALTQRADEPVYPAVNRFDGISSIVVREGPWVAYFCNYDRSNWARGFVNLYHSGHSDWVFSTLNSLQALSPTEKLKTRVDDLSDWAGFPHVRIMNGNKQYDSQKHISSIETTTNDGVRVNWIEPLQNAEGEAGGTMRSSYHFLEKEIEINLDLYDLVGNSQLDFHFMRRPNGFIRLWTGKEVEDIFADRLLRTQGSNTDRVIKADEVSLLGVQVDRTTFAFEVLEIPPSATLMLVAEDETFLHSSNLGGFRFRIMVPATEKNYKVKLKLRTTGS